jgi:hypothetical protein
LAAKPEFAAKWLSAVSKHERLEFKKYEFDEIFNNKDPIGNGLNDPAGAKPADLQL